MIRLNLSYEPRWFDLGAGLRLQLAPITTAIMAAARSDIAGSEASEDMAQEALAMIMAKAVARRVILDWEGVGDADGNSVPVTADGIDALLDIWPVFEAFQRDCLAPHLMLEQEKNASAPSPTGSSAAAIPIAPSAPGSAQTAPRA
ncbi:hypothetical protein CG51_00770 [Haematobacter missouriensis]|uniref:Uncharacterized protein n=1 Tax=Haematobacter missouriensis TaxID=366616 RepID=A0A212AII9_9RHOB|nr:hypothetical protein [Haematobacter missouriensis]KFI32645.1 hypothetical protein CG51_00770 [Haematobacter missouriensis]OWJ79165.1 hypothetical protein CDV53_02480 [Haematobacter missouriensis]OWJ81310.1 hypothetical protein CDV52_18800 [Haematobacter missouriensis]